MDRRIWQANLMSEDFCEGVKGMYLEMILSERQESTKFHYHFCLFLYVLVAQSCSTLCDPMKCSTPGSKAHGNSQARILE